VWLTYVGARGQVAKLGSAVNPLASPGSSTVVLTRQLSHHCASEKGVSGYTAALAAVEAGLALKSSCLQR
jgi:hypothetical protein